VASATATADSAATVAALVRSGIGVGLLTAVAACRVTEGSSGGELVAVPLADSGLVRRVYAYWYDVLLDTELGKRLLDEVLAEPAPTGAVPVAPPGDPAAGLIDGFAVRNGV
jgi:DNA-binding transcriptional LysR family regulator